MRALISVYDKTGVVDFARELAGLGYELVSTGGTFTQLQQAGLPVISVESVTGFPEILDGRVKTLHPRIHGGLLARQDLEDHRTQLAEHDITAIDILVSNLYPFESAVGRKDLDTQAKIEEIDIGGPAMVRASAKNFASVLVVIEPGDYDEVLNRLKSNTVDIAYRRTLAAKAFGHVSTYDSLVASFLRDDETALPAKLSIGLTKARELRYGENPQQTAAAYARPVTNGSTNHGLLNAEQLAGPELSFNNFLDADAAWNAVQLFQDPAASVVKHMVPCGLAVRNTITEAFQAAFEGDTVSAFGGIVALNRNVDAETATALRQVKLDIVIGPSFDEDALAILSKRKATRVLRLTNLEEGELNTALDVRPIRGGMLVQAPDVYPDDQSAWQVVTEKQPTEQDWANMAFAWQAARLVKSNAIVLAKDRAVIGLGAGQPNRLESVSIAIRKAGERAAGSALASDAFFPFPDGIQTGIDAGVTAVIQPGGSVNDNLVIEAANAAGITMIFTGTRHFRH